MSHSLVEQLRFTRSEFMRGIEGISDEESRQRIHPMNCVSWMVGHLADQENRYWVYGGLGKNIFPQLNAQVGYGRPPSTPPLIEMLTAWQEITFQADQYLENLTPAVLQSFMVMDSMPRKENVGTMLYRCIYHYWYHLGEASAVRQLLGHQNLPVFVGNMSQHLYKPEV
jgi:uncharacterized damage-inducible protein DinB